MLGEFPRTPEEFKAVIQALSVQGGVDPTLRAPAAEMYRHLLARDSRLATALVHDLMAWRRWDFVEAIRTARAKLNGGPLADYALGLYLRRAEGSPSFDAPSLDAASKPARDAGGLAVDGQMP